jgi:hypothetical protein
MRKSSHTSGRRASWISLNLQHVRERPDDDLGRRSYLLRESSGAEDIPEKEGKMIRRLSIFVVALIACALTALSLPPSTASDASVPTTTVESPSIAAGSP